MTALSITDTLDLLPLTAENMVKDDAVPFPQERDLH